MVKSSVQYDSLLDREVRDFIDRTNACYPEDTTSFSVARQREIYRALCTRYFAGYPAGIESQDFTVDQGRGEFGIRRYFDKEVKPDANVIYCHGGGYVVGDLDSHDDICAEICRQTGYQVFSIDYRLSPEYLHPTAFEDCLHGFQYVAGLNDLPVVMAGDSAGGNLVSAVSHFTRSHSRKPAGQVLIYPELGGDMSKGSYIEHRNAPLLTLSDVEYYCGVRSEQKDFSDDPTYAPLRDSDFYDLPPSVVFTAQCDPLCDDGFHYCDKILQAGGQARLFCEQGLVHGYLRSRHSAKRAQESFKSITDAISMLGQGRWDFD